MNQNPESIDWAVEPEDSMVCYCQNISKQQILQEISDGAKTVADVTRLTGAGKGRQCLELNPRKRCCHADIGEILKLYADDSVQSHNPQPFCCK